MTWNSPGLAIRRSSSRSDPLPAVTVARTGVPDPTAEATRTLSRPVGDVPPQRPSHAGQRRQEWPVDGEQAGRPPPPARPAGVGSGDGALGQFGEDWFGPGRAGGFAERAEGGGADAEGALDVLQGGELADAAETGDGRGEFVQQQESGVLVVEQSSMSRAVPAGGWGRTPSGNRRESPHTYHAHPTARVPCRTVLPRE